MSSPGTAAGSGSPSNKAAKAELARLDKLPEGLLSGVLNHPQAELSLQDKLNVEACCKELSCQICCHIAVNAPLTRNPALILKTDTVVMCVSDANLMRYCSFLQVLTVGGRRPVRAGSDGRPAGEHPASPKTCLSFVIETTKSTLPNRLRLSDSSGVMFEQALATGDYARLRRLTLLLEEPPDSRVDEDETLDLSRTFPGLTALNVRWYEKGMGDLVGLKGAVLGGFLEVLLFFERKGFLLHELA